MGTLGDFAGSGGYRGGNSDTRPGWIATLVVLPPVALKLMLRGSLVIPKEFERSNLALELQAGKNGWNSCFRGSPTNSVAWPVL
jgi:hypothetical protein